MLDEPFEMDFFSITLQTIVQVTLFRVTSESQVFLLWASQVRVKSELIVDLDLTFSSQVQVESQGCQVKSSHKKICKNKTIYEKAIVKGLSYINLLILIPLPKVEALHLV